MLGKKHTHQLHRPVWEEPASPDSLVFQPRALDPEKQQEPFFLSSPGLRTACVSLYPLDATLHFLSSLAHRTALVSELRDMGTGFGLAGAYLFVDPDRSHRYIAAHFRSSLRDRSHGMTSKDG